MKTSSQLLLTFLLNAVWQIALIAALASFGVWLLRKSTMRYQHWLWVARTLFKCAGSGGHGFSRFTYHDNKLRT